MLESSGRARRCTGILPQLSSQKIAKLADPDDRGWQRCLVAAYNEVGDALTAQGNLAEALKVYQDGINIVERLAKADPRNVGSQKNLFLLFEKVGDVLKEQDLAEALKAFQNSLAIQRHLVEVDRGNSQCRSICCRASTGSPN